MIKIFILVFVVLPVLAEEPTSLPTVRVLGEGKEVLTQPGAPQKISKEQMEIFKFTDVNRALKQSSGVYIREEEGQGLRPNIGLRGTNPDRSKKVVLLEDGVLIGPAPYSAPAAYYTPFMGHVESLEVYKGFVAVPYGPNSVGGAINYITRSIPVERTPKIELSSGAFATHHVRASMGESKNQWGYLLETSHLSSAGFKELDTGADTGFVRQDVLAKFNYKDIELKIGYGNENSKETYLGLTLQDFDQSPYRRYAASALDEMQWEHAQVQLAHTLQFPSAGFLKTTIYRHDFHREWYKVDGFRDSSIQLLNLLQNPQANLPFYRVISGQADSSSVGGTNGQLKLLRNDRTYYSQGIQTKWASIFDVGPVQNDLELTARVHVDQIQRDHTFDYKNMVSGQLLSTGIEGLVEKQNTDFALAKTLSFQDHVSWERWVFSVLSRIEYVQFKHLENSNETERKDSVFVPGLGVLYKLNNEISVRVSVNQAVTVAGLDDQGSEAKEESTNYELGFKYISSHRSEQADLVVFYNDYANLTGTCTTSAGCGSTQVDQQFNGGAALVKGVEARLAKGFLWNKLWVPVQANVTWLDATFQNSFVANTPEWGPQNAQVEVGDPLPYVPQIQYSLIIGSEWRKFRQDLAFIYQSKMYDQSAQAGRLEVEPYGIVDWSGHYELSSRGKIFAKVDNLLGRDYMAAIRPFGYRPGKPQSFMVGISYAF